MDRGRPKCKRLYDTLDVTPDATCDEIRRAYRKKALKTHPDMGGSSQSWDETALAHRILSNPDSRKLYDETGEEAEAHSECNLTHQAFAIIGTLLQNLLARKIDICAINLPQEMVAILYDQRRPPARQVEDFTRIEKAATEAARRVKRCSSEDNFLERMLLSQAQQARRILEKAIEHVDAINHAIELLEDCSFEVGG